MFDADAMACLQTTQDTYCTLWKGLACCDSHNFSPKKIMHYFATDTIRSKTAAWSVMAWPPMSHWISLQLTPIQSPLHCKQTQLISGDRWHTAGWWPFGGGINRLSITQAICQWSVFPVDTMTSLATACQWSLSHRENPYAQTPFILPHH